MTDRDLTARCVALLDTCADDSVICGMTAGRLHGFWFPLRVEGLHVAVAETGDTRPGDGAQ